MNKSQTIKLAYPVEYGDTLVSEITINRPKGKAVRKMPTGNDGEAMSQMMDVLAELINKPPAFVDNMDYVDIMTAMDILKGFFVSGPAKATSRVQ